MSFSIVVNESEAVEICRGIVNDLKFQVEYLHRTDSSTNETCNYIEILTKRLVEISRAIRDDKQANKIDLPQDQ